MKFPPAGLRALRFVVLLPFLFGACIPDSGDQDLVLAWDSAGIQVIENLHTPDAVPVYAELGSLPISDIGVLEGNPDQEFGRIQEAAVLPLDRILVADGQTKLISVFSFEGDLVHRFGGTGEGPGEFRSFSRIQPLGPDSVLVWDRFGQRISVFPTGEGDPRSVPFQGDLARRTTALVRMVDDGTLLARVRPPRGELRQYPEPTVVQDSTILYRLSVSGDGIEELGIFFSSERVVKVEVEGSIVRTSEASPPFSRYASWGVSGAWTLYADNARFQIDFLDQDGVLRKRVRAPRLERPLDPALVSAVRERQIEASGGSPEAHRMVNELFEAYPLPETAPAFTDFLVDALGFLWAREYRTDWTEATLWYVFGSDGRLAGKVDLPAGATVFDIGPDYVLLKPHDQLDVPRATLLPLIRLEEL